MRVLPDLPSILYANVRSVIPKMDEIRYLLDVKDVDIFMCSESWLNAAHDDCVISIDGYSVFRGDRVHAIGGGVAAWVKNSVQAHRLPCSHPNDIECLSFLMTDFDIIVLLLYVPPNTALRDSASVNDFIISYIDGILKNKPDLHVLLCGDLNRLDVTEVKHALDVKDLWMKPTYGGAQLDYILVSSSLANQYIITDCVPIDNSKVPHIPLLATPLSSYSHRNSDVSSGNDRVLYDLKDEYIAAFLQSLNKCSFNELYSETNLDKKVDIFYAKFLECLSHIPCKTVRMSRKDKPWMTPYVKDLINKRWQAYRCKDFNMYNYYKEQCKTEITRCKKSWANKSRKSTLGIWNVVAEVRGKKGSNPLSSLLPRFGDDAFLAAEEINKAFTECFAPSTLTEFPDDDDWCPLSTPIETFLFLDKLSIKKSTGADGIPNRFYKLASPYICEPLCHVVNCIISSRYVPTALKFCVIAPIPKCSPISIEQLRPISLLSVPAKLLEHHILKHTRHRITQSLPSCQFAYRSMSSTVSCLISVHDAVTKFLEYPDVGACFLMNYDFSKAFDCISHSVLIEKLKCLDFPLGFIRLITSYLTSRLQCVRIGNIFSSALPVTSGAPQGSLLGPFLFVLYCHDIAPLRSCTSLFMYADDISVVCPIYKSNYADSVVGLIDEFRNIQRWSESNGLRLNAEKTKALCIRKKNFEVIFPFPFSVVHQCKLLGVFWNESLSWTSHFNHVLKLVSRRLYILRVLKSTLEHEDLWSIYHMTIESVLLFSTQLFGSLDSKSVAICQKVFHRASKIICTSSCRPLCSSRMSDFYDKRNNAIRTLFMSAQHPDHALYPLVVHPVDGRVTVPFSSTNRRRNSFSIYSTLVMNGLQSVCI